MALYIFVGKKLAQKKISSLKKKGMFDSSYCIFQNDEKVWIPVKEKISNAVEIEGKPICKKPKSINDALINVLDQEKRGELINSFDIIGNIAIIEIPKNLVVVENEIANAIIKIHKNVCTVAKKEGPMEGEYRTRKLKIIFGERNTETMHTENGMKMLVDVTRTYFSPRLSFERKRIAEEVKDGEKILALFAGVGPFPLVIAKNKKNCEIVAIELNPIAVKYMEKNIAINKIKNITTICGDADDVVKRSYGNFADRVLMPLPKDGEKFLRAAYFGAKNNAIIHFYTFVNRTNPFEDARKKIFEQLEKKNVGIVKERVVRPFSPALVQVAIDFKVIK